MFQSTLLTLTAFAALAVAKPLHTRNCPGGSGVKDGYGGNSSSSAACALAFDGRIPANFTLAQFDTDNGIYNPGFVKGSENFSQIIQFATSPSPSLFDQATGTKPITVTINDQSIFAPSPDNQQIGFRRAELLAASNSGTDDSTLGVKTLHFSLAWDPTRPLNLTHEYQLVFLEDAAFTTNQFVLKTGALPGVEVAADALTLYANTKNFGTILFTTPFTTDVFHNFGLALDFNANTTQVFYSTGANPLQQATEAITNDISGQGQYHFGVLKKGFGGEGNPKAGFQPAGINEGVTYGGIFVEDSSAGCRSLS